MFSLPQLPRVVADATLAAWGEEVRYKTVAMLLFPEKGRSLLSEWIDLLACIMNHLRLGRVFTAVVSLFLAVGAQSEWDHELFTSSPPVYPSRESRNMCVYT